MIMQSSQSNGPYQLTYAQRALWFIQKFDPSCVAYNIPMLIHGKGQMDVVRFKQAFVDVVLEQPSLRSYYITSDEGLPLRYLYASAEEALEFNSTQTNQSVAELWAAIEKESEKPFNLERGPAIRVKLYLHSQGGHSFYLSVHHLNFDGFSMALLLRRLNLHYNRILKGQPYKSDDAVIDFSEFVSEQQQFLSGESGAKQLAFWLGKLSGEFPNLSLPADFPRPLKQTYAGAFVRVEMDKQNSEAILQTSRSLRVTPFFFSFALYRLLLHYFTGQDDVIVGGTLGLRNERYENTIGYLINKVALRVPVSEEKSFSEFVNMVSVELRAAISNGEYPFPLLVEKLKPKRDASRNPIFQANFTYMPGESFDEFKAGDPSWEVLPLNFPEFQFDLTLRVESTIEKRFAFRFEYNTDLFKENTILQMAESFKAILSQILSNPGILVSSIDPVPGEQRRRQLIEFNSTEAQFDNDGTVTGLFIKCVEAFGNRKAVTFKGKSLTYAELDERTRGLAVRLRKELQETGALSSSPGEAGKTQIVGILTEPSMDTMVGMIGVLKAGCAYLPIDPHAPKAQVEYMLRDSGAGILLVNASAPESFDYSGKILDLRQESTYADSAASASLPKVTPGNAAYVIYTSGTTGNPKGVVIEHRSLVNYVSFFSRTYHIDQKSISALLTSYAFDLGYTTLWTTVLSGGELHLLPEALIRDVPDLLTYFRLNEINFIKLTPSLLNAIVSDKEFLQGDQCKTLRLIVTGGEKIKVNDISAIYSKYKNVKVVNHYGPTETTIGVMTYPIERSCLSEFSNNPVIGRPIGNVKVYVVDKHFKLIPIGMSGELLIAGASVGRGYLGRADLTQEKFIKDPFNPHLRAYRSGDLARWRPDGTIEFLGRIDRQVKIRGYRVELSDIEARMTRALQLTKVAVIEKSLSEANTALCAYFVCGRNLGSSEVREALLKELPEYMIPSYFVQLPDLPVTVNGKLDMKALPNPVTTEIGSRKEASFNSENQRKLAEIWSGLLGIPANQIDQSKSFFELGGHSLLVIQMLGHIRRDFNVTIPFTDIYSGGTLLDITLKIETAADRAAKSEPSTQGARFENFVELKSGGELTPLILVHPIGGMIGCYREFAGNIEHRPVIGIQADISLKPTLSNSRFRDMATKYLDAILERYSNGRFILGGWSMGGQLALEMAQLAKDRGMVLKHPVIMIDSFAPTFLRTKYSESNLLQWFARDISESLNVPLTGAILEATGEKGFQAVLDAILAHFPNSRPEMETMVRNLFSFYKSSREAIATHDIKPYSGDVLLFQAQEPLGPDSPKLNGWDSLLPKVRVVGIPGNHYSVLTAQNAKTLSVSLQSAMEPT